MFKTTFGMKKVMEATYIIIIIIIGFIFLVMRHKYLRNEQNNSVSLCTAWVS